MPIIKLKHLNVLSVAKIGAIVGLVFGLIYGIILALVIGSLGAIAGDYYTHGRSRCGPDTRILDHFRTDSRVHRRRSLCFLL